MTGAAIVSVVNDRVGTTTVVVLGKLETRTTRAYKRGASSFRMGPGPGELIEVGTGAVWRVEEERLHDRSTTPRPDPSRAEDPLRRLGVEVAAVEPQEPPSAASREARDPGAPAHHGAAAGCAPVADPGRGPLR